MNSTSSRCDGGDENSTSPAGEQRVRVQKASVVFVKNRSSSSTSK